VNPSAEGQDRRQILQQGTGRVETLPTGLRLLRSSATEREYSNAQVGDAADALGWRPPLTVTVRARFSHPVALLRGTAGFGFWNAALGPGVRSLHPPRAVWFFFGGPPHDVPLALGVPGHGFKAAILDAHHLWFFALLPAAPIGFLLMRVPTLYRRLWPLAQRAIGVEEASLVGVDLTAPHTYTLHWEPGKATFAIDERTVLTTRTAPPGPLHFVAWIDNSYAIATPRGHFGVGLVAEDRSQWVDLEEVRIEPGVTDNR